MATHGASRGPKSPLVIDITRLGRRPGSMRTLQETVPAPRRIGIELLAIAQGAPLTLDLKLESVSEGVLVTGTVSAPTTGECSRCLRPIARPRCQRGISRRWVGPRTWWATRMPT